MGVEKEPKPKKKFSVNIVLYDNWEADVELREFRENANGVGRPKGWLLKKEEFRACYEQFFSDEFTSFTSLVKEAIGGNVSLNELNKVIEKLKDEQVENKPKIEKTPEKEVKKDEEKKKEKKETPEKDEFSDVNFGEFDNDKKDKGKNK